MNGDEIPIGIEIGALDVSNYRGMAVNPPQLNIAPLFLSGTRTGEK